MNRWLIDKRKNKGLSQKDVSERAGISQPSYCNIENGSRRPSVETAKRIAEVLGFNWTEFFESKPERQEAV